MGFLALTLFLGILVGSVVGQAIGLFVPEGGVAHQLFVNYEFHVHVNLMSVIGVFLVAQLLRWIR